MNIRKIASAVMISLVALGALASPALADNDWGNGRGHNKHRHHRHHEREVVYAPGYVYGPPRVVYAPPPRVVYAPPPVYYAAPPVMYEAPSPSINFVFPLR
ncbi:MAG: hypothetical protein H7Y60_04325 [Rhodospirillaceae bacterium]|nr:hypothetical protein [Rhodospirillales bacterium]